MDDSEQLELSQDSKKKFFKIWLLIIVIVAIVTAALLGYAFFGGQKNKETSTIKSSNHHDQTKNTTNKTDHNPQIIILKATASAKGKISLMHDMYEGSEKQTVEFDKTWEMKLTGDDAADPPMITVTGLGDQAEDQKVSCEIIVDGKSKVKKEATGKTSNAHCMLHS